MRKAEIERKTFETQINLQLIVDGSRQIHIDSGIGFFDHLLTAMAFHAGFDLEIACVGDLEVDSHHTIEDIGLCLGQGLKDALGEKEGIRRFASAITPMDESLVLVAVDICNRPLLVDNIVFKKERLGEMDTENVREFLRALAVAAGLTLHIDFMRGTNDHHKAEALFKGLGLVLKEACQLAGAGTVSTKGVL